MSQAVLAGLAGVSQSYISQIEADHKSVERRTTLVSIAAALHVTVTDLLGTPGDPSDPERDLATASVPAIRAAIIEIEEGQLQPPTRGAAEMAALVEHVDGLRARSEYGSMAHLLASFLRDAASYGGLMLLRAAYETSVCLRNLGFRDLALPAARIAVTAAAGLESVAWMGAARFAHTLAMPIESAGTTALIADRSLSDLQQHAADPSVRQMLGQMHLSASMAYAVDGDTDTANDHLNAANAEAITLGDPTDHAGFNLCSFGPTNLALWHMSVDVELGEYGRVIETAKRITPDPLIVANRHQSYWMSYGRALTHSGRTDREALVAFMRAERVAPTPFAMNPMIRDSVVAMVYRAHRRSVSEDLRIIARRLGVAVAP